MIFQKAAGDPKLELRKTHDFCASGKPELTVVLIHGIATDSNNFQNALRYLEGTLSLQNVRFITFDLLGAGKSYSSDKLNYDFRDQIIALHNSILKLKLKTPLVLIGHSMGSLIAVKYADEFKQTVKHLILVSTPTYPPEILESPEFKAEMEAFKKHLISKDKKYADDKMFNESIKKIVMNKYNYARLINLKTPATLIYSREDEVIMPMFGHKAAKANSKYLTEIAVEGKHAMSREKYTKIPEVLNEII